MKIVTIVGARPQFVKAAAVGWVFALPSTACDLAKFLVDR